MNKIEPYYPYYCKAPNKLIMYEDRQFEDCIGNKAIITVAIYLDKGGKLHEADAHIKWLNRN